MFAKTMMMPATMPLLDSLEFLALFVREITSNLPVRLTYNVVDTPASLPPNLSELDRGIVDDG